ncbi:hypothetical protein BZM27_32800 [Paraburkholderia steynii]|uniref:Uncharacterized protein n=1 Tax=Paraburkholderia steynii TaxID=1245441 RepID=A0A4R0XAD7_9BURK|nr:hypothetical protein BZM27_32800 [Paraburkholderia steynii]
MTHGAVACNRNLTAAFRAAALHIGASAPALAGNGAIGDGPGRIEHASPIKPPATPPIPPPASQRRSATAGARAAGASSATAGPAAANARRICSGLNGGARKRTPVAS